MSNFLKAISGILGIIGAILSAIMLKLVSWVFVIGIVLKILSLPSINVLKNFNVDWFVFNPMNYSIIGTPMWMLVLGLFGLLLSLISIEIAKS